MDAPRAGAFQCVGCHTLSRDGSRIAVGMDIPAPSPYKVFEVGTRTELYQMGSMFGGGGANFNVFSPDGSEIMTSNGVWIDLRDATTGAAVVEQMINPGTMPDWSPDGEWMVYAKPETAPPCIGIGGCGATGISRGSLEVWRYDGSMWEPDYTLVQSEGENNYYPAISPDGEWVLFNRAIAESYDAPDATLWVIPSDGGDPVRLDAATSNHGDSWPKWDVTVYQQHGQPLMWFTVTSRRAYGLRLDAGEQAQIWMGAFEPSRTGNLAYPMFWLPFQEIGSGNHIAQWTTTIDRQPCSDDSMCEGGELCAEGACVPDFI